MSTTWTLIVEGLSVLALDLLVREAQRWGCETALDGYVLTVSGENALRVTASAVMCGVVGRATEVHTRTVIARPMVGEA